jgi:hypothetical protein
MPDLTEFTKELETLLNRHNVDNYCNIHDFVLANLLTQNIVQLAIMTNEERRLKE